MDEEQEEQRSACQWLNLGTEASNKGETGVALEAWERSIATPSRSNSATSSRPRSVSPPRSNPVDEPAYGVSKKWVRLAMRTP